MRPYTSLIVWVSLFIGLPPLTAEEKAAPLIWRGCGISKQAFMNACANEYEKVTGINIQLSGGGATLGIEAAASGGADLGGTCRGCLTSLGEHKLDVSLSLVAWDALVVVVHKSNPLNNITTEQLRKVLKQEITNWKPLNGKSGRIIVVARRGKTSGVGYSTRRIILDNVKADYGPTVIRLQSSGPVEKLVLRHPRAIAVTGVSSARQRNLKILSIDGHEPSVEKIASGAYPFFRPLYMAYKPKTNARAKQCVDWLLSEKGQNVIAAQKCVPLTQGATLINKFGYFDNKQMITNYDDLIKLAQQKKE